MPTRRTKVVRTRIVQGILLDHEIELTLGELCRVCGVNAEFVIDMVTEGALEPAGASPRDWRFTGVSVPRIQKALSLQRDLGVNLAGAALALDLLDEVNELRRRVRVISGQ